MNIMYEFITKINGALADNIGEPIGTVLALLRWRKLSLADRAEINIVLDLQRQLLMNFMDEIRNDN